MTTDRHRFLAVALTGGIATGKSYCLHAFAALGVPVIDADVLAHEAVEPGAPALAAIETRFGSSVIRPDGRLDREALGRIVFADSAARRDLEAIVHPAVYTAIRAWFDQRRHEAQHQPSPAVAFAIADIPLLYETGREHEFDRVIVAACTPEQQLERLVARSGLPEEAARQRIASQLAVADKARRADYLIDTSAALGDTDRQVIEVTERLRAETRH